MFTQARLLVAEWLIFNAALYIAPNDDDDGLTIKAHILKLAKALREERGKRMGQ